MPDEVAFVGGPVATMDAARSFTDAVLVRDGRIAAVGEEAVRERLRPATEVVQLRGRLLLPGFHDAHVHPVYGGMLRLRCDLSQATDGADCLRIISEHLTAHPDSPWLLGGGWDMAQFPGGTPTRRALDSVTGDRPAYLVNRDHHGAWVNSVALRLAGIDRATPDPPDGRIERDPAGRPDGTLHEGATRLVEHVLPEAGSQQYLDALVEGQRHLHERGVTSWHDAIIGRYLGYDDLLATYLTADDRGLLTGKVRGALWWDRDRGSEQVPELVERRKRGRGRRFRAEAVKIMQDGVCENATAALRLPYLGHGGRGLSFVSPEALAEAVPLLTAEGFQLHFHAVGDRAVRDALDAVSGGPWGLRHQVAHLQVVHPGDVPRFRELGVAATIQPRWAVNDAAMVELNAPKLGHTRTSWQYPFRSLRAAGAVLAAGSDWPVSEADPMLGAHVAVTRCEPGSDDPLGPEEALELTDALAAYTAGSAWVNHVEQDTGTIEVGKAADLVVLDADPFSLPPGEIASCGVDLTVVDGEPVHQR
ncbi:amidohydrolase [Saccharopolyspora rhizosphaerae]|uniref:Amidohydrolase n=1 Tax=Saccharopolyspora rhizosphaerae TaxID=2492662 RepID=A0A3R8Q5D9_9PSEU|nr:amidohydrolase [Saccharopolyspora rhizosphaerae]RRO18952.1 amidohydrolase [Saccharopolyspora rhizosphaerae]